jgi:hypothetical protein
VDCYDSEYRRQYCRERVARVQDDYRRAQAPPKAAQERERVVWAKVRSVWERKRRRAVRAPAYRS